MCLTCFVCLLGVVVIKEVFVWILWVVVLRVLLLICVRVVMSLAGTMGGNYVDDY